MLRGAGGASNLERLPATALEAKAIASLLPSQQVERLEGFAANRARFLASKLDQYRYIHIASHGLVDAEIPQLSALILSTRDAQGNAMEGRVMAADFLTSPLSAQVVVLSACDTALGKNITGEGLMGLRYVMLARGAQAVVASLWQVPDQFSSRFMTSFYTNLLKRQDPVATALSSAMRAMLAEQVTDPAVWGAFGVSVGNLSVMQ
jgi:CHAT domain-containing protein